MPNYYPSHNYGPEHYREQCETAQTGAAANRRISDKQLAANQANAKKSTGPRTEEGKARSSQNALRHALTGQIHCHTPEDRAAHEAFTAPLVADLHPVGPHETQLAHLIANEYWRLHNAGSVETNIFALGHYTPAADIEVEHPELHAALTAAQVFLNSANQFQLLTLYEQRMLRAIKNNLAQLKSLQADRTAAETLALDEAADLTRVAEHHDETIEDVAENLAQAAQPADPEEVTLTVNGSVFSSTQIESRIHRADRLREAEWRKVNHWDPTASYPYAA